MQIPASVTANWPPPNHVSPETRGPTNIIFISVLLGVAAMVLGIRLYTRVKISHGFGLDDVLISLAFVSERRGPSGRRAQVAANNIPQVPATAFASAGIAAEYRFQWNRHAWDVDMDLVSGGLQLR